MLTTFSAASLFTFIPLPIAIMMMMSVVLIPCLMAPGMKVGSCMKAIYCYMMQAIGVAMMSAGALPAVYGVLEKFSTGDERFSAEMYLALLILFSMGGVTYLLHEQVAEKIDDASRRVPALLFWYSFKVIGTLITLVSVLSFLLTMLLFRPLEGSWWLSTIVMLLYGLLLAFCTRWPQSSSSFRTAPIHTKHAHSAPKKRK
ncbi:hypothetical protein EXS70_03885 [Candidatus Peribacteria bacterium]|nr:hypothetical protein [Candidatus Peribacteria bacterium]